MADRIKAVLGGHLGQTLGKLRCCLFLFQLLLHYVWKAYFPSHWWRFAFCIILMVILIWKNVARLFQNVLVQPQIIIACLGTLPLLKNQGVRVWWGGGLWTAVISSAAQWLCNWGNLKRHPYTDIHGLYQQGGKTGEVSQWNVEYGLQSDQDIHCSSTISVGGYPDFSPLTSPLHRGWVDCIIKCSQISAPPSSPLSGKYVLPVQDATELRDLQEKNNGWAGVGPAIFNHTINTPMHSVL